MIEIKLESEAGTSSNPAKIIVIEDGKVFATITGTIGLKRDIDGKYQGYIDLTLIKNI